MKLAHGPWPHIVSRVMAVQGSGDAVQARVEKCFVASITLPTRLCTAPLDSLSPVQRFCGDRPGARNSPSHTIMSRGYGRPQFATEQERIDALTMKIEVCPLASRAIGSSRDRMASTPTCQRLEASAPTLAPAPARRRPPTSWGLATSSTPRSGPSSSPGRCSPPPSRWVGRGGGGGGGGCGAACREGKQLGAGVLFERGRGCSQAGFRPAPRSSHRSFLVFIIFPRPCAAGGRRSGVV